MSHSLFYWGSRHLVIIKKSWKMLCKTQLNYYVHLLTSWHLTRYFVFQTAMSPIHSSCDTEVSSSAEVSGTGSEMCRGAEVSDARVEGFCGEIEMWCTKISPSHVFSRGVVFGSKVEQIGPKRYRSGKNLILKVLDRSHFIANMSPYWTNCHIKLSTSKMYSPLRKTKNTQISLIY